MRTHLIWATWCLATATCGAANPEWISFGNFSTNDIYVSEVVCDGKQTSIPCGILNPGGTKASSDMFPRKIPNTFSIVFQRDSQTITQNVSGKQVSDLIKAAGSSEHITVHFLYSHNDVFIPKVEARGENTPFEMAKLLPDENDPRFQKYKTLIRAAYDGDAMGVRNAIKNGAPFVWPDNPVGLTPLEWAVRWNKEAAFDELIAALPPDYSVYNYAHCIQIASQAENAGILSKLLTQPLADKVPKRELQEIFYTACYTAKSPRSVEMLLAHYPVGIDYRVRDFGHTLLFVAVQGEKDDITEWLVNHGANKSATLQNGSKPIDFARDERTRKLLQ